MSVTVMKSGNTDILEAVYIYIKTYIETEKISPTIREIANGVYIGRSTASRYLDWLEAQGRITRVPGRPRSIHLLTPERD